MSDNIDKNEIRRAIDRLQIEHPCHFAFDATKFDSPDSIDVVKRVIDNVMESIRDDADIHIICEMAKLYLDGVTPIVERPHGEWIDLSDGWQEGTYECSNCKTEFVLIEGTPEDNEYNFCPNCGADMRKKEGDEK